MRSPPTEGGVTKNAPKTKAGGVASRPALQNNSKANVTSSHSSRQQRPPAAAVYAGTVLREARNIVERVHKHGPGRGIKVASQRLREALDSLDWLCEYVECEVQR